MDNLNVGGGVCIWPEMVSMRMSQEEMYHLAAVCVSLCAAVIASFFYLHGKDVSALSFLTCLALEAKHTCIFTQFISWDKKQ